MTIYAVPAMPVDGRSKFVAVYGNEKPLARKVGVGELIKLLNSGPVKVSPAQQKGDENFAVLGPAAPKEGMREVSHAFFMPKNLAWGLVGARDFRIVNEPWLLSVLRGETSFMIVESTSEDL